VEEQACALGCYDGFEALKASRHLFLPYWLSENQLLYDTSAASLSHLSHKHALSNHGHIALTLSPLSNPSTS
jgi:hypothetical protein